MPFLSYLNSFMALIPLKLFLQVTSSVVMLRRTFRISHNCFGNSWCYTASGTLI